MHWLDSFVQGSLASQPHPVIVRACAHTYVRLSEGYALPSAFHFDHLISCTVIVEISISSLGCVQMFFDHLISCPAIDWTMEISISRSQRC